VLLRESIAVYSGESMEYLDFNTQEESKEKPETQKILRLSDYRESSLEDISDDWDYSLNYQENFKNIFKRVVCLPSQDLQIPVVQCYAILPSVLCHVVPILYLQGNAGCGKTNFMILFSGIYDSEIKIGDTTTYAALRNDIKRIRYDDKTTEGSDWAEKNCCMLFDNLNENTLNMKRDPALYAFFLQGYKRLSENISISKGDGTNENFKVFCPKIISTVWPIHLRKGYEEVCRRMFPIRFESLSSLEKKGVEFDHENSIDPNYTSFRHLHSEFTSFWHDSERIIEFNKIQRKTNQARRFKELNNIDQSYWELVPSLLAAGIVSEVFPSLKEGIDFFVNYHDYRKEVMVRASSSFDSIIKEFIESKERRFQQDEEKLEGIYFDKEFPTAELKSYVDKASSEGALDVRVTPEKLSEVMESFGYKQIISYNRGNPTYVWRKNK
jgi:hypothetical protein